MEKLERIHDYLLNTGIQESDLKLMDDSTVYLALEIAEYAHKGQKRLNGESYINHPLRLLDMYRGLVGIDPERYDCVDVEELEREGIPFKGVQEVCVLHDVIEDTDFSIDDLRDIYKERGFDLYFKLYIETPLMLITHDKKEDYECYILKCMQNPTSSLVKMIDLNDNTNVFTLDKLNDINYERTSNYLKYIKNINDKYHFIERFHKHMRESF